MTSYDDPVMLHVFRRRQTFSHCLGRSSGSGGCSSACSGLVGPLIVVFVASCESPISAHVWPKWTNPLPTLINPRSLHLSHALVLLKAIPVTHTVPRAFTLSYLFFPPLENRNSRSLPDKNTERRPCANSCLFVRTLISAPFSLSSISLGV